jgi:pyruvate,water dikinase
MTIPYVRWFREIGRGDRAIVGGKGASLGELERAHIPVPPGFVITTSAFRCAAESAEGGANGFVQLIGSLDHRDTAKVSNVAAQARNRLETTRMPAEVRDAVAVAYRELTQGTEGPVAVRSSATAEDSEEASFAGLQDTYLWVCGLNNVIDAVQRCWASLYSVESVVYRRRLSTPESEIAMGVVVQTMVNARCSGVMFTRSPLTGDRSVIAIEASWGLGSAIVSGEVTPDRISVNKITGEIVQRVTSRKHVKHVPNLAAGGVRVEPVADDQQSAPCLNDSEIAALCAVAKQAEELYGLPVDIEWAMGLDMPPSSNLLLLQSRPETVWRTREQQPIAEPKTKAFDHVLAAYTRRKLGATEVLARAGLVGPASDKSGDGEKH